MAEVFKTFFGMHIEIEEPNPARGVAAVQKAIDMQTMRMTMTTGDYAGAVAEQRRKNARIWHPRIVEGLVDPEELKELPGRFQVALANRKVLSSFRKGRIR
jgi:hypothetical protein